MADDIERPEDGSAPEPAGYTPDPRLTEWLRAFMAEEMSKAMTAAIQANGGQRPPLRAENHNLMTPPVNAHRPDTPNDDFIHGVKGKLSYTMEGVATPVVMPIESISFDNNLESDDITNSSSNGWKIRLDGLQEITGNIVFVYSAFNVPGVANPFKPRIYCTLHIKPDGVTEWVVPALISGLSFSSGPKAGSVRVTCKYESSGEPTLPTASQTTPTPMLS